MRAIKVAAATVGLSAALTGTAVGLAGSASAAPGTQGCTQGSYPPASSTVALDRSRASVGMSISFQARCFKPGETVRILVDGVEVGAFTADANGVLNGAFKVPAGLKPGRHTLSLTAGTGTQTAAFIVVPSAATTGTGSATTTGGSDSLAFTGSDAAKTAGAGIVLLLGGGALIVAAKRRKHANAAA